MGICYHKCFLSFDFPNDDLIYEKSRKPSFVDNYCVEAVLKKSFSGVLKEDRDHLFKNEEWFKDITSYNNGKPFLDVNKFMDNCPHYKIDQIELDRHWKQEDIDYLCHKNPITKKRMNCLAPDWKFLIRKGVPMKYMRTVILHLFNRTFCNNEMEYKAALEVVFKGKIPTSIKNCPSFSEKKLEDVLALHYLTTDGLLALKKILWVLKESFFYLEYSPMIVQIVSLFLMFMTEAESFCCIKSMVEISHQYLNNEEICDGVDLREMRWYFTFDSPQFLQFCYIFFEEVKAKDIGLKTMLRHFNKLQFKYIGLFEKWTKSLYLMHIPLSTALKVFVAYLNEGVKIYFRVSYGICYMLKEEILNCTNGTILEELIQKHTSSFNLISSHQMLRISYALTLTEMKQSFLEIELKENQDLKKCRTIFRPKINEVSDIISYEKFETVWDWLPHQNKLNDAYLLFSTRQHGFSLANLYNMCHPHVDKPTILLIRNDKQWVFGVYCDCNLEVNPNQFRGGNSTFCFILEPFEKKFEWQSLNSDHMRCELDFLSFGSGRKLLISLILFFLFI